MRVYKGIVALLALTLGAGAVVIAQKAPPAGGKKDAKSTVPVTASDPQVKVELDRIASAYRDCNSLSFTLVANQGVGEIVSKLSLKRPNLINCEVTRKVAKAAGAADGEIKVRVVADGKDINVDVSADKTKYFHQAEEKLDDAIAIIRQAGGVGVGLLPILLQSAHAENEIVPSKPNSLKMGKDGLVNGESCTLIEAVIRGDDGNSLLRFYSSKKDHLLRKVTISMVATPDKPVLSEVYKDINYNPTLASDVFTFTPVPGAVATEFPKQSQPYDPRLKVGADPIALTGEDLDGKPVRLEDYKGKVLLIDFWATWCGPCVAELPNVIAAYNKYHDQGFEVVGVSLDRKDARSKVVSFTKENKMPWRQIYDGGYWEAANAKAYSIQSIPFTLLVGKDGKIVAVGARGEALAPAIEAALK